MNKKNKESIIPIFIVIVILVIIRIIIQIWNNEIRDEKNNYKQYNIEIVDEVKRKNPEIDVNEENRRILKFIEYCNEKKPEKAYELLTSDCKSEMYPTLDEFIDKYYKEKFNNKKLYSITQWKDKIYKVDFKESAIYTGKITESTIQDFMIVTNSGVNINNYIGKYDVNMKSSSHNIKITALYKNVYIDHEEYTFSVENNNKFSICLNEKDNDKIYMIDSNELKYYAYMNELTQTQLEIDAKSDTKITIKFPKAYNTDVKIKNIVFPNIITNKEKITITLGE